MIYVLPSIALLVLFVITQFLRRIRSTRAPVERAILAGECAALVAIGTLAALADPIGRPLAHFFRRRFAFAKHLESAQAFLARQFGDALARGDRLAAAQAVVPDRSRRLVETDIPDDLLPDEYELSRVKPVLVPALAGMDELRKSDWQLAIDTAVNVFLASCALTALVAFAGLVTLTFPSSALLLMRLTFGGLCMSAGLGLFSLAVALAGTMMVRSRERCARDNSGSEAELAYTLGELEQIATFASSGNSSGMIIGKATGILRVQGVPSSQAEGRDVTFDDNSFQRGVSIFAGDEQPDAAALAARMAREWLASHAGGVIALDLHGGFSDLLVDLARTVKDPARILKVGTRSADRNLDISAGIAVDELEGLCRSMIEQTKSKGYAKIAGALLRHVRIVGPLFQELRRIDDRPARPEDNAESIYWAIDSIVHDRIDTIVTRIESVRRAEWEKIEYASHSEAIANLTRAYEARYSQPIGESIEFLKAHWIDGERKFRTKLQSAFKECFGELLGHEEWARRTLCTRQGPGLDFANSGDLIVLAMAGRIGKVAGAFVGAAITSLCRAPSDTGDRPLVILFGAELSVMGQSALAELLNALAASMTPRIFVVQTARDCERLLRSQTARSICGDPKTKIYFRTSDALTIERAICGLNGAPAETSPARAMNKGAMEMDDVSHLDYARCGREFWNAGAMPATSNELFDDRGFSDSIKGRIPGLLDAAVEPVDGKFMAKLPTNCALVRWIRLGVHRCAIAKFS